MLCHGDEDGRVADRVDDDEIDDEGGDEGFKHGAMRGRRRPAGPFHVSSIWAAVMRRPATAAMPKV